jgi:MFS superfamily sulfate permease-like transporter
MAVVVFVVVIAIFLGICFFVLAPLYRWSQNRQRAAGVRTTEQIRMADAMSDALRANQPRPQPQQQAAPLSLSQRLSYLDAARQAGQITQAEYDQQRAAIIRSS